MTRTPTDIPRIMDTKSLHSLSAWASSRFSHRIAIAAVVVTAVLLAIVGMTSYVAIRANTMDNVHQRLRSQADGSSQYLELHLNGLASSLKALAENTLTANALTDSQGRNIYLQPFLRDFRLPFNIAFDLSLCDFEGVVIATNHDNEPRNYQDSPWLSQVIDEGRPVAIITPGDALRPQLMIAVPVLYPATGMPEGVLVLEAGLHDIYQPATTFLPQNAHHWLEHENVTLFMPPTQTADHFLVVEKRPLVLNAPLSEMNLAMSLGETHENVLTPLNRLAGGFMAAGVILLVLAALLSLTIANYLTRSLTNLSDTAQGITKGGSLSVRLAVEGRDETAVMAESFNRMIEQLAGAHETLEQQVVERTIELRQARDEAESANRAKSAFLAAMSHEIRTPMNTLLGVGEILQDSPRLSPQEKQFLAVSRRAGDSLMSLINDILDISKIEAGQLHLEDVAFNPAAETRNALAIITGSTGLKDLEFTCKIGDGLPPQVRGDPQRLRQVLLNLLSNAAKFTGVGHISLSVEPLEGERLLFAVEDTGIGIPESKLEMIFQPFTQAESSTTRRFGGTGLGLTICRQLVERMGGTIWVESEVDQGSVFRFTVHLPWVEGVSGAFMTSTAPVGAPVPVAVGKAPRQLNILLVDDVEDNRMVVEAFLGKTPHRVRHAASGAEALQIFNEEMFDLVLMDVQMPGMDGYEATHRIRTLEADRNLPPTPIVALTANAMKEDVERSRAAGCDHHLSKPMRRGSLLELLARYESQGEVLGATQQGEEKSVENSQWPTINTAVLSELREEVGEFFPQLLENFLDKLPLRLDDLSHTIHKGDLVEMKMAAHKLKGVTSTFGADGLSSLCVKLETQANPNGSSQDCEVILARILSEAGRVRTELGTFLAEASQ